MENVELGNIGKVLESKIRDKSSRTRVLDLLRKVQEAYGDSGLTVPVGIIGSSVIGKDGADVDIYLETNNILQREREEPHDYKYLERWDSFKKGLQRKLGRAQIHDLGDEFQISQLPKNKYGYSFSVNAHGVEINPR